MTGEAALAASGRSAMGPPSRSVTAENAGAAFEPPDRQKLAGAAEIDHAGHAARNARRAVVAFEFLDVAAGAEQATRCPPAEEPKTPIFSGSMLYFLALALQAADGRLAVVDLGRPDGLAREAIADRRADVVAGCYHRSDARQPGRLVSRPPCAAVDEDHRRPRLVAFGLGQHQVQCQFALARLAVNDVALEGDVLGQARPGGRLGECRGSKGNGNRHGGEKGRSMCGLLTVQENGVKGAKGVKRVNGNEGKVCSLAPFTPLHTLHASSMLTIANQLRKSATKPACSKCTSAVRA